MKSSQIKLLIISSLGIYATKKLIDLIVLFLASNEISAISIGLGTLSLGVACVQLWGIFKANGFIWNTLPKFGKLREGEDN